MTALFVFSVMIIGFVSMWVNLILAGAAAQHVSSKNVIESTVEKYLLTAFLSLAIWYAAAFILIGMWLQLT